MSDYREYKKTFLCLLRLHKASRYIIEHRMESNFLKCNLKKAKKWSLHFYYLFRSGLRFIA